MIIKKLKNISIVTLSIPTLSVDAQTETTDVNLNQHAIISNIYEMITPLLNPESNRLSSENNPDGLVNLTSSNEEGSS